MRLHCFPRAARLPRCINRIPQTDELDAGPPHAHGPTYTLDCDFADAAACARIPSVHDVAVVVVVAREGVTDIPNLLGNVGCDVAVHDVLVLVAAADGDGVAVVGFEGWVAGCWGGGRPVFAEGTAGGAWGPVEGHVGEEDGGEFGDFGVGVGEGGLCKVFEFDQVVGHAGIWV